MRQKTPTPLSANGLAAITARYFERHGVPSTEHLRRVLSRRLREAEAAGQALAEAKSLIEAELQRLQRLGILNDARTAAELAGRMHRRGDSAAKIRQKLHFEGMSRQSAEALAGRSEDEDPELSAARTWARKHRVGPWRKGEASPELARKEAARMGRAGFGYGLVKRVLGAKLDEDVEPE